MRRLLFLFTLSCVWLNQSWSQDRDYGRSMVVSDHGIVATSQVLASQAGSQILSQGGSAIDAAIAANAVLGVTEPMMNGIGGDLFLLYWDAKSGKLYGLNASGWAPQGLTIEFLKKQGITSMPEDGIHSVTVPGAVDGWDKAHQRFGKLAWKVLFEPAIYYAENGYSVPEIIHDFWGIGHGKLKQTRGSTAGVSSQRKAACRGGEVFKPRLRKDLEITCGKRASSVLRGRNCASDSRDIVLSGRHDAGGRPGRIFLGVG
jgi:gamma-glutamyltranspeptidase / glutathione hydrolase